MRILKDEHGNVLVLTALSFTLLVSFLAFAVDIGNLYYTQRQLQTLADSAAMAGALELAACGATPSSSCGVMQSAATTALTEGGNPAPALFLQCAPASGAGLLLTLNNGPCALGATDPNNANANYVEAVVTKNVPTYFAGLVGFKTFQVSARAEAGHATASAGSGPCLNTNSLTLNSGASVTDATGSTCGINDNDSGTLNLNSGVTIKAGSFTVHGKVNSANCGSCSTYSPIPTGGSPVVPDPFSSLTPPSQPATSSTNTGTISGNTTLEPGYYPNTINFNSGTYTVTLDPGLYYFGGGFNINSGVTVQGSGVTLLIGSGANVNMNSAANLQLTAPTTALSNCASCAGMLIWDLGNLTLDSASTSNLGGAVYVPNGTLTLNSGSNAGAYGMIYAKSAMLNSAITLSCSTMPNGICPGGSGGGPANGSTATVLAE